MSSLICIVVFRLFTSLVLTRAWSRDKKLNIQDTVNHVYVGTLNKMLNYI